MPLTKGILYYTDNRLKMKIARLCRQYMANSGLPVTSVSRRPTRFGHNIVLPGERSHVQQFKQILAGLEAMTEDIVYFCEHDVLYPLVHFEFNPPDPNKFYYNGNYWFLRLPDGFAIHYNVSPLSGLVAYREALITHFRERVELIEKEGFSLRIGFEPFTHRRIKWKTWYDYELFNPPLPNIDISHGANATWKRWSPDKFRRKPTFWEESNAYNIPGWPNLPELLGDLLEAKTDIEIPQSSLSIVIPARNEEFIGKTVESLLNTIRGNTEILVGLDGYEVPVPPIPKADNVVILNYDKSIGQRAITNQLVKLSKAKYIAKVDAHCNFDEGFDIKLLAKMKDNYTMVPIMRNLWAFDWKCPNGHTRYQGPSGPCKECGLPTEKDMKWIGKSNPQSTCYRFDQTMHFQYFNEVKQRDWYKKQLEEEGLTETMSLQGSFFLLTRDKYWELNICDEKHGSWGQQGVEVACKTWLSGGRVVCNHDTWYAHMFRTQGGDFGFPYKLTGAEVDVARQYSRQLFKEGKWSKAIHDLQWLIDKFSPVPDWN